MRFKIYFEIDEVEDSYFIYGETVEEIQEKNKIEMEKRGLDKDKNFMYSIEC